MNKKSFNPIKDHSKIPVINVANKYLIENGNVLHEPWDVGREYKTIINEHNIKSNGKPDGTHGTEKLTYCYSSDKIHWKGYIPILRDFNGGDGLEDPFLIKANGKYVVGAEHKPIGMEARDTVVFANTKIENLKGSDLVKTIKPKYHFDSHSIMSPMMKVVGNAIWHYYEGRYDDGGGWEDLQKFQVGLIIYRATDYATVKRYDKPIVDGYTIFDDITDKIDGYYYVITHDYDSSRPLDSQWRGQIWRSQHLDRGWSKWTNITGEDCYPIPQMLIVNGKIDLFYAEWRVFKGIRLAHPNDNTTKPPDNGGNNGGSMKPVASLENNVLKSSTIPNATLYEWQWSKNNDNQSSWIGSGKEFPLEEDQYKQPGVAFFVYAKLEGGGRTDDSERVVYDEEPPAVIKGCTDPNAINYNPDATEDDGSCIYEPSDNNQLKKDINKLCDDGIEVFNEIKEKNSQIT